MTFWQVDEREEAGVEGGQGVAFLASARIDNWRPFVRMGYTKDAGVLNDRSISIGTGYDARGGSDYELMDFLLVTPAIQYVVRPAFAPETDEILVLGLRLRAFF